MMAASPPYRAAASSPAVPQPTPVASLREMGVGGLLVIAYLTITRIGHLEAAKIGVQIGPVPLFLTEIFIIAAAATAMMTRTAPLVCWLVTGGMARMPGVLLWLLFLTSILYALLAVGEWGVLAIRDLAIFAYGIVFALAYIVLDTRAKAAAAMRWFTYSGVVLAVLLILDTVTGTRALFVTEVRILTADRVVEQAYGGGDVGGIISFSLMALLAYAIFDPVRRGLHMLLAAICFYGLTITQTRSAILGLIVGMLYGLFGMRTTQRLSVIALAVGGALAMAAVPILLPTSGLAHAIVKLGLAIDGGMRLAADDNFYFRLLRWDAVFDLWRSHPLFGVGFGQPLIPDTLLNAVEVGGFNAGLPHNTYLTVLARLGVFGFLLIMGAWIGSVVLATRALRRPTFAADAFAAGAALMAMMGYATFVLFLERPMHAATLWIVAAIACRLADLDPAPRLASNAAPILKGETPIMRARRIARAKGFR